MRQKNKICIIGVNKKQETDKLLINEAEKIASVDYVPISDISLLIDNGINLIYENKELSEYDFIIFRISKTKYHIASLILQGLHNESKCLQSKLGFDVSKSRLLLYQFLSKNKIKVPRIIFSDDPETAALNLELLRFPILIKVPTDKKKVMLANTLQEAKSMMDALQVLEQPILLEEYYPEAKLIQVFILNNKILTAVIKTPSEINYAGGEAQLYKKIDEKIKKTALKVSSVIKSKFLRVDIINTAEPTVVDVDLCPFISNVCKVCNFNIAEEIMKFVKNFI
ncbi:MAG: hypothetical protein J7K22_00060 [Nanoarchaeota archaeon]|nr:hypothetical protein [Nanoarchaeota archaeon]